MKTRSYEFYEVRASMVDDNAIMRRGSYEHCMRMISERLHLVDDTEQSLYLVRVQVVTKYKPGDEDLT